ncbi:hypothetical protein A3715_19600 [Oleiphilus sp. HI0009]|nr:hypothetical protein A3715_10405 [Oleiphilus sp. HI0009]KZX79287.1 hypothetical protein A3715_19600 [Oleiphilus sp. HI0009]
MAKKHMTTYQGWVGKADWENFNFKQEHLPKIRSARGRKRDYAPENWPPVKVSFEAVAKI